MRGHLWHIASTEDWSIRWEDGDTIGCAADLELGQLWFGRNGVWSVAFEGCGSKWTAGLFPAMSGVAMYITIQPTPRFAGPTPEFRSVGRFPPQLLDTTLYRSCTVLLGEAHMDALVARLADSESFVRKAAWELVTKLGAEETLAQHVTMIATKLEDSDPRVRRRVVQTLGKLEPAALAQYGAALAARLEDVDEKVRYAAVETMATTAVAAAAAVVAAAATVVAGRLAEDRHRA